MNLEAVNWLYASTGVLWLLGVYQEVNRGDWIMAIVGVCYAIAGVALAVKGAL